MLNTQELKPTKIQTRAEVANQFKINKMIRLNEQYSINNGQGSIVFTEDDKGTVNALYTIAGHKSKGKINGILAENVLKGTFHIDEAEGLIEFTFSEDGFDAKWKSGLEPGPLKGKWEGNIGENSSSEIHNDASMKKVHYFEISITQDAEGNDLAGSENAAEFIYEKIKTINSFIKDRIDNEVQGFLFEDFLTSFDSTVSRSINSPETLDFIENKLKTDLIKEAIESDPSFRFAFIFDPKEAELRIWKDEFIELSELLEDTFSVYGYHSDFGDIVVQMYDNGDYDTGIIACDQEIFEGLSLSDYMKSESESGHVFPQDSIFELSNYSL